jgi:hypothetical protein
MAAENPASDTERRFTRTASDQDRQHNVTNADRRRGARSPNIGALDAGSHGMIDERMTACSGSR